MNDSVTHRTPDPRDASASENFNAEWSFMLWTFIWVKFLKVYIFPKYCHFFCNFDS